MSHFTPDGAAALPLQLTVAAVPADGPADVPTTLVARLANSSGAAQIVNRRMLLNSAGKPGEVLLDVDGPVGWVNPVVFRIRCGPADSEFFVQLAPGESVERSWNLDNYAALNVPGRYVLTVTYHQDRDRAPDGRPVAVGAVVGTTEVRRHS